MKKTINSNIKLDPIKKDPKPIVARPPDAEIPPNPHKPVEK